MKTWFIIFMAGTMIIGCRQKPVKREPTKTILEGKKVDVSSIYKKRSGDLVEALYDELVSNSTELTELELQIKELRKQGIDSLKDFKTFNEKIDIYYGQSNRKIDAITDSVLKKKLQLMIYKSRRRYSDSIAPLKDLDSLIKKRTATINDLHTILKLVKTLPLIEDFQREHRPPTRPADNALYNLDSLARQIDSLVEADTLATKFKL
jgi:predicted  nucleic acid-binding Zn-ribbon protein